MKKTIISLLALAGVSMAEDSVNFTLSNTGDEYTKVSNLWHNGSAVILGENSRLTETSTNDYSMSDYETVALVSITTGIRDTRGTTGVVLTLTDGNGVVQATSTNYATASGLYTWNFTDVNVSTSETLYFVFTAIENENVKVGNTLSANSSDDGEWTASLKSDLLTCCSGKKQVVDYKDATGVDSLFVLGSNTKTGFELLPGSNGSTNPRYTPVVSIVTASIPEPTTATLSLLALAGLAARRR